MKKSSIEAMADAAKSRLALSKDVFTPFGKPSLNCSDGQISVGESLEAAYEKTGLKDLVALLRTGGLFAVETGVVALPSDLQPGRGYTAHEVRKMRQDDCFVVIVSAKNNPSRGCDTSNDLLSRYRERLYWEPETTLAVRMDAKGRIGIGRFLEDIRYKLKSEPAEAVFCYEPLDAKIPVTAQTVAEYIGREYPLHAQALNARLSSNDEARGAINVRKGFDDIEVSIG